MRDGQGSTVLVIFEELEELFTVCDRIAALAGGSLYSALPPSQLRVEGIGLLMTGAATADSAANRSTVAFIPIGRGSGK